MAAGVPPAPPPPPPHAGAAACPARRRRAAPPPCAGRIGYSFAESGPDREAGERRNRTWEKKASAELSSVVKGLVGMSQKQLAAVSHLLTEEQLHEIGLAARLPRVNQGRKRHENRVAQLIRDGTSDPALQKLAEAVRLAQANASLFTDPDAAARVEGWVEGLKQADPDVLSEVSQALSGQLDMQQLRQLATQMADADSGGGGAGGGDDGASGLQVSEAVRGDPELLALIARRSGGGGKAGSGGGGGARQKPRSPAERRLRALLQPAALRQVRREETE